MTKETLAAQLDGCEYRSGIPAELIQAAKENNFVIITGASDDLVELHGAIHEELGATSTLSLSRKGVPVSDCDEGNDCPYYVKKLKAAIQRRDVIEIKVHWCGEGLDSYAYDMFQRPTWCFDCSSIAGKFVTFDIFDTDGDDREYFCRGIVIDLDEIFPSRSYEQMVM